MTNVHGGQGWQKAYAAMTDIQARDARYRAAVRRIFTLYGGAGLTGMACAGMLDVQARYDWHRIRRYGEFSLPSCRRRPASIPFQRFQVNAGSELAKQERAYAWCCRASSSIDESGPM